MAGLLKKKKRVKRGGRKYKPKTETLVVFSSNAAGLKFKVQSLKNEIRSTKAGIFTIQETHLSKKGKLKVENFEIFEAIRKKQKGGTVIGVHKAFKPMLIEEYSDSFELLVVEIQIRNKEIRIISGYGPQETWKEEERLPFFQALEQEIIKVELLGKPIFIEMDSNSKLGSSMIPNDPHVQSQNGKVLAGIINRHGLIVANGLRGKCKGTITRRRETTSSVEESTIDHVIISEDLEGDLIDIRIDEERNNGLVKIVKTKKGVKKTQSDHNPIICNFNVKWCRKMKNERIEMFNLKNKEGQAKFKQMTSNTNILSNILKSDKDLNTCTKIFVKGINKCIRKCFQKIRITDRPNKEIEDLFNQRRSLRVEKDEESKLKLEEVEKKLADLCAQNNFEKINDEIKNIDCEEGGLNSSHLWKLKKKLSPRCRDPPTAMLDREGNLITSAKSIEALAVDTYKKRLENREIKDDLKQLKEDKEELCRLRIKIASKNKTPDWTMAQLDVVLEYLKKNKSRDPLGFANEIFMEDAAGDDLKLAILILVNRIKSEQMYPEILEDYDISSIYKNKGARNNFENYRGIFRVPIFRSILDRLIYNDEYSNIDSNLSDSNVGARKNRNIRDNIFVMNAITNSVINGKESPIDIQIFDIEKCFDALWVEECINDAYEAGLDNDKLTLLFLENQNANVAIKTQEGKSERVSIKNIIMQGTVWGSLLCTATMDKLGQLVYQNPALTYKYKGVVETPSLGMVDDIMCIQRCSNGTVEMNAVVNAFVEGKKLKLSKKKCHRIHVQSRKVKNVQQCADLKIHNEVMNNAVQEKYLGDLVNTSGTIRNTVEERKNKGFGIVNEIIALLDEIPLGRFKMEIGLKLRQAMLLNGMLYNSEAWHAVSEVELRQLESVDEHLLRALVKGHAKTPLEFLYLEAGAIPIRMIVASRRLMYHQAILKREETELTHKIYKEQINNTTPGDFVELLAKDFELINVQKNDAEIRNMNTSLYKQFIKKRIKASAFTQLSESQQKHSKVRHIEYEALKTQTYMTSPIFSNEEVNLLHALRSRMTDCKVNFRQKYASSSLVCNLCAVSDEDQQHILNCKVLTEKVKSAEIIKEKVKYAHLFSSDVYKQKAITVVYEELFQIRKNLSEKLNSQLELAPSPTQPVELMTSDDLLHCIDNLFSGK